MPFRKKYRNQHKIKYNSFGQQYNTFRINGSGDSDMEKA